MARKIKFTAKMAKELIGWYGAMAILLAYALLRLGMISARSLIYQGLNISGALGIVHISLQKKAYQPAVLNAIWALIALIAMARMLLKF